VTDEPELRELLFQAAELPDSIQPPVQRLIERGRVRRTRRAAISAISAAVVVAAAATLPSVLAGSARESAAGRAHSGIMGRPENAVPGPSAAELARFRWSDLPPSPLGPRSGPLLAWTGRELIELGGTRNGPTINDGAAFDIGTGRWHRIAQVTGNVGFANAVTAWTGRQLFVTNGQTASCPSGAPVTPCLPHAGLYDPATNRWKTTLLPKQMAGLTLTTAVWTGRYIVVGFVGVLGTNANNSKLGIAAYDPASNRWQIITPALPRRHPPVLLTMMATSNRLILWSIWDWEHLYKIRSELAETDTLGVDVLALGQDGTWRDVTGNWPQHLTVDSPAYAGEQTLIPPSPIWYGRRGAPDTILSRPRLANSSTLALTTIPVGPLGSLSPLYRPPSFWLWNGRAVVTANVGPAGGQGIGRERLAAWDPASGQWHRLPSLPGSVQISDSPLWAGPQLLELTDAGALWSFHR
jgi:hypothetical protein